ncbi:exopolysaccharide biosynthesis polyprenyl glycosylphosphotransferase [Cupriavidus laharis]|nr:exopolysaccharide biosynthesis polyprenyl glycosylphosphotransferase [Cupriavidus laharis]
MKLPTRTSSETIRRRSRMLAWAGLGLLFYGLAALAGHEARRHGLVTQVFLNTIAMSVIPYAIAYRLLDRTMHMPPLEGNNMVAPATLLPFALLLAVCATFRIDYSRGAMLVCMLITLLWLWSGYKRFVSQYIPTFGYSDPQSLAHLNTLLDMPGAAQSSHAEFRHIVTLPEAVNCDGLMMDRSATVDPERTRALARFKLSHVHVYSVERIAELLTGRLALSNIDENFLDDHAQNFIYAPLKRISDIAAVLILAPIAIPIGLIVAAAIRLESSGPAIFRQERVGLYGKVFTMFKFRSMADIPDVEAQFAAHRDPRITRVGRFIRKYRLDEIPQLWNVFVGQMSLIGPRPEQASLVDSFSETIPYYPYRHLVRPGLSGWAQVQQGYAASHEETITKLSYDLYYVKHCSMALDLLIASKTIRTLLTGYGAR